MILHKPLIKLIFKTSGVILLGAILGLSYSDSPEGARPLISLTVFQTGLLAILLLGFHRLYQKRPQGWGLMASFMYFNTFNHIGITAWLHLLIAAWFLWNAIRWSEPSESPIKTKGWEAGNLD